MTNKEKNTNNPKISIVIGTLNRPKIILDLLENLSKLTIINKIEVIVFDQSNEINYQIIKSFFENKSNFKLIKLDKPNTITYLNLGWKIAKSNIVLYLDDDIIINESAILAHITSYKNKKIKAVAGRVINEGEKKVDTNDIGRIKFFGAVISKNFNSDKQVFVNFPYGCNMSFRKSVLEEMNGFDNKLKGPIYSYNEVDLGYRISKKYRNSIIFEPKALIYHKRFSTGGTRSYNNKEVNDSNSFNYGYFIGKNFSLLKNIIFLIRRIIYQIFKEPKKIPNIMKGFIFAKKNKLSITKVLILLTFLLIIFLRLWKVPDLFNFTFSEEMQAFMAWEQIKNFHPIWIGVSAANINYYLGPGFTYLNYLLFLISKDPAVLAYFSAFLGIITIFSIYYIVKEIFDSKIALFSTIIYGASTLINFHDRRFWNPTPIPFISIWLVYSLIKARKNTNWFILTSILVGLFFHTHLSLLLFVPTILFIIIINIKKIKLKIWVGMVFCYLLVTSPLIIFDFVHNFDNLLMPIRTIFGNKKVDLYPLTITGILNHIKDLASALGRMWFIKFSTNPQDQIVLESHMDKTSGNYFLSLISILCLIWFFIRNKKRGHEIFTISILTILIAFVLYPSYNPEYYLMSFLILTTIAIAFSLTSLPNKFSYLIIVIFLTLNVFSTLTMSDKYGLTARKKIVKKTIGALGNRNFRLETYGELPKPHFSYAGWRYLFKVFNKTPNQSNIDQVLGWIYPDEINNKKADLLVIMSDTVKPPYTKKPINIVKYGVYSAYIFKND